MSIITGLDLSSTFGQTETEYAAALFVNEYNKTGGRSLNIYEFSKDMGLLWGLSELIAYRWVHPPGDWGHVDWRVSRGQWYATDGMFKRIQEQHPEVITRPLTKELTPT